MKKYAIFALIAAFMFGITACGEESGETGTESETTATTTSTGDVEATPSSADELKAAAAEKAQGAVSDLPLTSVSWSEEKHDFGKITQGEKVQHTFRFTNTGENPLKIENVKPSCGCTTPDWTKEEVAPGSEGYVTVEFDSKGKSGVQNKSVTVTGNIDGKIKVLAFTGTVVAPGEEGK